MEPSTSYSSPPSLPLPFNDPQLDLGGDDYKLLQPTKEEEAEVRRLFAQRPPEGYEIKTIERVYAPRRSQSFLNEVNDLQAMGPASLDWIEEDTIPEHRERRKKVWELFEKTVNPYHSQNYSSVHFLPLWHGTKSTYLDSILKVGYRYSGLTDGGFFGKGSYFTEGVAYASLYSEEEIKQGKEKLKILLLNWVVTRSTYPVIYEDQGNLFGKSRYKNYDAHFAPVVPSNPFLAGEKYHEGLRASQVYRYKELVVFQAGAALPRYVVKVGKAMIKSLYPRNALFQLFQILQYRRLKIINAEDIQKSWQVLITPRSSSSSSSSLDDYEDSLISCRNLFQKILLNLFSSYASESLEPDLEALTDKITQNFCTERSRGLIKYALDLFYQSAHSDFKALDEINWLILFPLQFAYPLTHKIDLLETAFEACFFELKEGVSTEFFNPLVGHLAKALSQLSDSEEILKYYHRLFPYPDLRKEFFKKLEALGLQHLPLLLDIPDITGFRFSFERDQTTLHADLMALMHDQPHVSKELPQVKMCFFFAGESFEGYLDSSVVQQLKINQEGNIHKFYKDASHPVAKVTFKDSDLHFKQYPMNPWMEHAVHSLMYRIAGRLSPPIQLVRIEVVKDDKAKVYPVQVSRTIVGQTLKDVRIEGWDKLGDAQKAHWTWLFLCSILTHPGDGRNSNYIVDSERNYIFCIDNDIAFVEPVTSGLVGKTINFGAAPFCYFTEAILDPKTLEQFVSLDAQAILEAWVADLLNTEEGNGDSENRALFSQDEINQFKQGYVYKKHLLLREGTLVKLKLQFLYLQEFIKKAFLINQTISALDLLKALVTLRGDVNFQSNVGGYVYQQYKKSFKERQQDRLNSVLSRTASLTQKDADKAHYGTVLTKEKVATAEEYRLEKAREELYISLVGKSVNFNGIGPARQLKTLQALRRKVLETKQSSVTINHCSELDFKFLESFLHSDLVLLDLSYCPKVDTACLELIQKRCPKLQELNITGCNGVKALATWTLTAWNFLEFSSLRVLKARDCSNLSVARLKMPSLRVLDLRNNSVLAEFTLDSPRVSPDIPDVDLIDCPIIPQSIKLAYKRTALEILKNDSWLLQKIDPSLAMDEDLVRVAITKNASWFIFANENLRKNERFVLSLVEENPALFEYVHEHLKGNRNFVIELVQKCPRVIKYVAEAFRRDPDIVLNAITQYGLLLDYADESLKRNEMIVLSAVKQTGYAFRFADRKLRLNEAVVLKAVSLDGMALAFASEDLRGDEKVVMVAVRQNGLAIEHAHSCFRYNKEVATTAVLQNVLAFKYIDEILNQSKEFLLHLVQEAVKQSGYAPQLTGVRQTNTEKVILHVVSLWGLALEYASEELKRNEEIVLAAVEQNGDAFQFADMSFRESEDVVSAAVCRNGFALKYASEELKLNRKVVLAAVLQNGYAFQFADPSLRRDVAFVLEAVSRNGRALKYASEELKLNRKIVLAAVLQNGDAFRFADPSLRRDVAFVLEAVSIRGLVIAYISEELKKNKDIVLNAVRQNHKAFYFADPSLRRDPAVVLEVVSCSGEALEHASEDLRLNEYVVLAAVRQTGLAFQYADFRLRSDKSVVLAAVSASPSAFQYASKDLQEDREVVIAVSRSRK